MQARLGSLGLFIRGKKLPSAHPGDLTALETVGGRGDPLALGHQWVAGAEMHSLSAFAPPLLIAASFPDWSPCSPDLRPGFHSQAPGLTEKLGWK